ncbi:MAG: SIR2 family protein [Kiritimatiellae bacterium]|nr:SIR2 family protein [Kiritimatiellia bacterium]
MQDRILFLGNGVNLCNKAEDWFALLEELEGDVSDKVVFKKSKEPFTMMFDSLIFKKRSKGLEKEKDFKLALAHKCRRMQSGESHHNVLDLNYRCIITTNYDHCIQNAWLPEGKIENSPAMERKFNLFRRYFVDEAELWHFHGDCMKPNTITIGFDDYVKQLCEFRAYYGGSPTTRKNPVTPIYKEVPSADELFHSEVSSWIDRFMLLPIDIRGYKMDFSEIDFWWLLAQKHKFCRTEEIPFDVRVFLRDQDASNNPQLKTAIRMGATVVKCGSEYAEIYRKPIYKLSNSYYKPK